MQSIAVILSALLPLVAQAAPNVAPVSQVDHSTALENHHATCAITGDGVRYRTCATADDDECPSLGQYAVDTPVHFLCWTTDLHDTSYYWDKTSGDAYVAEEYVDQNCVVDLPAC